MIGLIYDKLNVYLPIPIEYLMIREKGEANTLQLTKTIQVLFTDTSANFPYAPGYIGGNVSKVAIVGNM